MFGIWNPLEYTKIKTSVLRSRYTGSTGGRFKVSYRTCQTPVSGQCHHLWCLSWVITFRITTILSPCQGFWGLDISVTSRRGPWDVNVRILKLGTIEDLPNTGRFGIRTPTDSETPGSRIGWNTSPKSCTSVLFNKRSKFWLTIKGTTQNLNEPGSMRKEKQIKRENFTLTDKTRTKC